jgi:hypothetical protein
VGIAPVRPDVASRGRRVLYLGVFERQANMEEVWLSGPSEVIICETWSFYDRLPLAGRPLKKSAVDHEALHDCADSFHVRAVSVDHELRQAVRLQIGYCLSAPRNLKLVSIITIENKMMLNTLTYIQMGSICRNSGRIGIHMHVTTRRLFYVGLISRNWELELLPPCTEIDQ